MDKAKLKRLVAQIVDHLADNEDMKSNLLQWESAFFDDIELAQGRHTCDTCEKERATWVRSDQLSDELVQTYYCKACLLEKGIDFLAHFKNVGHP